MALQVSQPPVVALSYTPFGGQPPAFAYNYFLITPPRHFIESIGSFNFFFYEPGNDYLVAVCFTDCIYWPGWEMLLFVWDAGSGALLQRQTTGNPQINNPCLGSYNKIYARGAVKLGS